MADEHTNGETIDLREDNYQEYDVFDEPDSDAEGIDPPGTDWKIVDGINDIVVSIDDNEQERVSNACAEILALQNNIRMQVGQQAGFLELWDFYFVKSIGLGVSNKGCHLACEKKTTTSWLQQKARWLLFLRKKRWIMATVYSAVQRPVEQANMSNS